MRNTNYAATESFAEVFRDKKYYMIVPAVLLTAAIALTFCIRSMKSGSEDFHSDLLPKPFDLNPIEMATQAVSGTVLTETDPVDDSYFADALFVGDSLCDGVRVYNEVFPGYKSAAKVGLSIDGLLVEPYFSAADNQKLSAIDHVELVRPSKLYIMIGTNDIVWNDPAKMADSYGKFIDEVLNRLPSCKIVVQSIPPTTAATAANRPKMSLERIRAYNAELKLLAMEKGVYFLDVHSVIAGEDGYMPYEIAAADGYHMQANGYARWRDYMKSHPVQSDASYSIGPDGLITFTQGTGINQPAEETAAEETANE